MPHIRVVIEGENGATYNGFLELPEDLLPSPNDDRFTFLKGVDPYGDTIFNRLQIPTLLDEVAKLKIATKESQSANTLGELEALCKRCLEEPHRYLKFIGD